MIRLRGFVVACVLSIWISDPRASRGVVAVEGQVVMGTVLEVTVDAPAPEEAQQLAQQLVTIARHWEEVLSPFSPYSELSRLLRQQGHSVYVDSDLLWALHRAAELSVVTRGAFDPAYRSASLADLAAQPRPRMLHAVTWHKPGVMLRPHATIDPGAFGKGLALDAMVVWARSRRAREIFVNFGGSSFLREVLSEADQEPRHILLPDTQGGTLGIVELRSGSFSVSTSGPHDDAVPIVDPASGKPVAGSRLAAVWAPDGTSADAWSTALIVLGPDGISLAERNGVEALVSENGRLAATRQFPWCKHDQHLSAKAQRKEARPL